MAAGVSDTLLDMEWIAELVEAAAPNPGPRGHLEELDVGG
jgi:hypothetical protein